MANLLMRCMREDDIHYVKRNHGKSRDLPTAMAHLQMDEQGNSNKHMAAIINEGEIRQGETILEGYLRWQKQNEKNLQTRIKNWTDEILHTEHGLLSSGPEPELLQAFLEELANASCTDKLLIIGCVKIYDAQRSGFQQDKKHVDFDSVITGNTEKFHLNPDSCKAAAETIMRTKMYCLEENLKDEIMVKTQIWNAAENHDPAGLEQVIIMNQKKVEELFDKLMQMDPQQSDYIHVPTKLVMIYDKLGTSCYFLGVIIEARVDSIPACSTYYVRRCIEVDALQYWGVSPNDLWTLEVCSGHQKRVIRQFWNVLYVQRRAHFALRYMSNYVNDAMKLAIRSGPLTQGDLARFMEHFESLQATDRIRKHCVV